MSDAELIALAAAVQAETANNAIANQIAMTTGRDAAGYGYTTAALGALEAELRRRGVL